MTKAEAINRAQDRADADGEACFVTPDRTEFGRWAIVSRTSVASYSPAAIPIYPKCSLFTEVADAG